MGFLEGSRAVMLIFAAVLLSACADPSGATPATGPKSSATPGLSLSRGGSVLHHGVYCRALQTASPGNNTLPVANGCLFNLSTPADLFGTDASNYSVSKVVGQAEMGVRGTPEARVIIACRLHPRAQFWFWIAADGHWNISSADDIRHPKDLLTPQQTEPLRQYVRTDGTLNQVQFKCAGSSQSTALELALNVNDHHFAAVNAPLSPSGTPLERPSTPWFVDVGARLTTMGPTMEGTVAKVTLFDHE